MCGYLFEISELIQISNPYFILVYGLLVGLIHAFEPDHISAMSTQLLTSKFNSSKQANLKKIPLSSSLRGMFWGMGHTSSIILVGLVVAGLSLSVSSIFFLSAELLVGVMLVVLGISVVLNKNSFKVNHIHPHRHGNEIHTHAHTHDKNHRHNHKSYLIGCIHGLAGSGAVVILLSSALGSLESVLFFLTLFGIGSIIGMSAISALLGIPFALISNVARFTIYLKYATAAIAFVIGAFIIYEIVSSLSEIPMIN